MVLTFSILDFHFLIYQNFLFEIWKVYDIKLQIYKVENFQACNHFIENVWDKKTGTWLKGLYMLFELTLH